MQQQQPLSFSPTSSTEMTSMMSSNNPLLDLSEQLGYVQCSFCTTILLVSVPCSSLLKVVTVRCGHCTGLLSVSLVRTSIVPVEILASLGDEEEKQKDFLLKACSNIGGDEDEEDQRSTPTRTIPIINKPPEKRQRAPSAYNRFIREEILRIKARDPTITHKEAFSAAAKNWAHFPRIQHNEERKRKEGKKMCDGHADEEQMHDNRHSYCSTSPAEETL
ncbi:protein YABBY 7-like [Canna indica]|uniref:Protein YABBY 7-like n=1 Tax=Canna indica TaxID=4628 RepID=A0AAQ3JQ30_9LILI|nr:protein YABBY 7-like [Canna indica]